MAGQLGIRLTRFIEEHVAKGGRRGYFPEIKGIGLPAGGIVINEEAASAEVSGRGQCNSQGECRGNGRINRVSPALED
jgi:hypothetical protein